jgi:apolipoprotein D and lipocalin family protein
MFIFTSNKPIETYIKYFPGFWGYLLVALYIGIGGCASVPKNSSPELKVVPYVDLDRYLGRWYEIALYPNWFEEGCFRSTAFYEKLKDGKIKVTNQCRMYGPNGNLNEAVGIANIGDGKTNSKLRVQFFWPFKGDYWIIDLDEDYQYAIVSEPDRQYLWILSRSPIMDDQKLDMLKAKILSKGFDLSYLEKTKL